MRKIFAFLLLIVCENSFSQSKLKFEKDTIDLGTTEVETDSLGHQTLQNLTVNFPFINSGNEPLIITNAVGNGSGSAIFPKDPILPGKKGNIKATFTRYRYTSYLKKDETLRPFITYILIQGNFPEAQKYICVKGLVKKKKK